MFPSTRRRGPILVQGVGSKLILMRVGPCSVLFGWWSSLYVYSACSAVGQYVKAPHVQSIGLDQGYLFHEPALLTQQSPQTTGRRGSSGCTPRSSACSIECFMSVQKCVTITRVRWPPAVGGGTATRRYARRRSINELRMRSAGNREEDAGYVY